MSKSKKKLKKRLKNAEAQIANLFDRTDVLCDDTDRLGIADYNREDEIKALSARLSALEGKSGVDTPEDDSDVRPWKPAVDMDGVGVTYTKEQQQQDIETVKRVAEEEFVHVTYRCQEMAADGEPCKLNTGHPGHHYSRLAIPENVARCLTANPDDEKQKCQRKMSHEGKHRTAVSSW